jgi:hypothetical protein
MKADPILEELWRVKDKLSREMTADPAAYQARLDGLLKQEEQAGRRILNSPDDLRRHVAEQEQRRRQTEALTLNETPPRRKK